MTSSQEFSKKLIFAASSSQEQFLKRKRFFCNIKLIRFRLMCHMTTSNHFGAKWSFLPLIAKSDRNFDHEFRISCNACFWNLQITCFLLIYDKPYNRSKFRTIISKSIGRFPPTRFPGHVTRKWKKGRNNRMRNSISNTQSETMKIFHIRMSRFPFSVYLIIWSISWPSDSFLKK